MPLKLSDYVCQFVADQGVRHVFMLPGGGAMHLNDSLGACSRLESVCCLHEQACAIAAEASARVTSRLGVAMVTTGPGGTNAITGVAGAWLESTPCLILSGQVKRADMKGNLGVRQLGPQELDIVSLVSSITKYAVTVTDPSSIRYHLEKAAALATHGRKGPVWIDIPLDVQAAQIDVGALPGFDVSELKPPQEAEALGQSVEATLALLAQSKRPVLLVGNGVSSAGASESFLQLVDRLGVPVLCTWMGADLIPADHPLAFGKPGIVASRASNFTVQNADLILAIGARLDATVTGFDQSRFARGARKVVVDVDPGELEKLRMVVDVPVVADARAFIEGLLARCGISPRQGLEPWIARCQGWRSTYPVVLPEHRAVQGCVNPFVLAELLSEESASSDLIVPGSSGAAIDAFWLAYRNKPGQRLFSTGGLGAMGFGLPAAMGACLASGGRRTISVDGDGGFQMNIQELATVARLGLPVKYFVLNNGGYASIRTMQRNHFHGHLVACDASSGLGLPDTLKVAAAYGLRTARLSTHAGLREGLRAALEYPGPMVCDVMLDPDWSVSPKVSSVARPDGSMVSRPLEDLWPFLSREELASNMLIPLLAD